MIGTVAELLDAIANSEAKQIEAQGIKHPPTIGGMYEHLTSQLLSCALPTDQRIQVVSGFIEREDGTRTRELDCMLVLGEVRPLPHSNKVVVPRVSQVIAVVQVKKSLNSKDFATGHENIRDVRAVRPDAGYATHLQVAQAFELITRIPLVEPVSALPPLHEQLFHLLRLHLNSPACIVLGYYGYKGHRRFREGLAAHLQSTIGKPQYGPLSLPDAILNANVCAVKNVAMPWAAPLSGEWWPVLMTSAIRSPHLILLEIIWTRLVFRGLLSGEVFGDDLDLEQWTILATMRFNPAVPGWALQMYDKAEVAEKAEVPAKWAPIELTLDQYILVNRLCESPDGSISIAELSSEGLTPDDMAHLGRNGLVGRDPHDPARYRLLTQRCRCVILPDGRYMAAEDNSGRLSRWVAQFVNSCKRRSGGESVT